MNIPWLDKLVLKRVKINKNDVIKGTPLITSLCKKVTKKVSKKIGHKNVVTGKWGQVWDV